jgi:hypothetical protein
MGSSRGAFVLAGAVLAALVALVLTSARTIENGEIALAEAKLDFILLETEGTIERNLGLGLPLAELQQVEPLLERTAGRAPEILAVDVFNPVGVTLFSTDRGAVGEPVPREWLAAIAEEQGIARWRSRDRETTTLGVPLLNDFGRTEGFIALILTGSALAVPLSRLPELLLAAAPVLAGATLLAAVAGWLIGARADRRLLVAADALRTRDAARLDGDGTSLGRAVAAAIRRSETAGDDVDAAALEMRRIDAEI